jgi:uncharacterized protein
MTELLFPAAWLLILVGILFSVVPILPGSLVVWLGILVWANADGFHIIGWPLLVVLGAIALIAVGGDIYVTTVIMRKSGGSWKAVVGSIIGGLAGGALLSAPLPFIGTIIGGIIGSVLGVIVVEYFIQHAWGKALKAGSGFLVGYLASTVVRLILCLAMIAVFALKVLILK